MSPVRSAPNLAGPTLSTADGFGPPTADCWSRWVAIAVVTGIVSGCGGPPRRGHQVTAAPRAGASVKVSSSPAISAADLSRGIRPAPWAGEAFPGLLDPKPVPEPAVGGSEWLVLPAWARTVNLPTPVSLGDSSTWEIGGPHGRFQLIEGTRQARFDGMDLWLGYPPRRSPDGLHVHRADAAKNLRPLLVQHALPTPGRRRIVLDPGHGGRNAGTISVLDQRPEKEFVLDWALRLAPLLAAGGWEVFLTRTNDVELGIPERVAMTDAIRPHLFLSLHFNSAAPDLTRSGVETYCLTPVGLPSTLTRNYEDDTTTLLPNNAHDEANLQYAVRLHRAVLRGTDAVDRGIRRARFMAVLLAQNCPAVLIEGGFLSHPREAAKISSPAYRQRLAESVAAGLLAEVPALGGPARGSVATP